LFFFIAHDFSFLGGGFLRGFFGGGFFGGHEPTRTNSPTLFYRGVFFDVLFGCHLMGGVCESERKLAGIFRSYLNC
jgi:hypothetical protein